MRWMRSVLFVALVFTGLHPLPGQGSSESPAPPAKIEAWFHEYMNAMNSGDVAKALSFCAPGMTSVVEGKRSVADLEPMRRWREWEAAAGGRFDFAVQEVKGNKLTASLMENNPLWDALGIKQRITVEYEFDEGRIRAMTVTSSKELGAPFDAALEQFEAWLVAKPAAQREGLMRERNLIYSREAGCKLVPLLIEWKKEKRSQPDAAQSPTRSQVEGWFRAYMTALNGHDVEGILRAYAPNMVRRRRGEIVESTIEGWRNIREWETPMRAHFDYEIVSVKGDWLTARMSEANLLYSALEVRRPMVSEYRWCNGAIVEMNLKEIRETGRDWNNARAELEAWLATKPAAQTAGLLNEGRLLFTGEGGRKLVPFLAEYRRLTAAARVEHEKVMRSYIAAMNRHDVDGQYSHYSTDMHYVDGGQRITPRKEEERDDREFEAGSNAKWSYTVVGAGLDNLEMIVSEGMDFYDGLGVGPRSHRARYRFRDGKIVQAQAWDWTEAGRPYRGARDRFAAWLAKERPEAAARVMQNGQLLFKKHSAVETTALAREWFGLQPCRLYHPSVNSAGTQVVFSSDCEGPWGIYVALADGSMARRVTPRDMEARMPNWSPDGTKLVFQVNGAGNWDIYTVNVDGSGLTRMTDHPRGDSSGVFSPDGAKILFASDRGGINELFVIPAAGGEAAQITRNKGVGYRSVWAPDGSHVLYRASVPPTEDMSQPGEFYRVRPDGSDAGVVLGGKRREANQAYSPDGRQIVFDAHEDGVTWESGQEWDVWVMNADGSGRRNLTAKNKVNDWGPSWSPDGKTIVFLRGLNNIYDLHVMNADGSNVRRITHWTVSRK